MQKIANTYGRKIFGLSIGFDKILKLQTFILQI